MVGMLPSQRPTYLAQSALVNIRAAGQPVDWDIGAKECLDFPTPSETPAENQKYRHERKFPVGSSSVHPATVNDVLPEGPFGRKNVKEIGDDTATAMKLYPKFTGGQQVLDFNESRYERNVREPLGRAYIRGHEIPEEIRTLRGFGQILGAKKAAEERLGLKTIFPENPMVDPDTNPEVHALYIKSHNQYAPGEARDRHYDWARTGVDPKEHAFGYRPERVHDGVRKALNPASDPGTVQPLKIVPAHQDQIKTEQYDVLGKPKFHGSLPPNLPADTRFGRPSIKELAWGAGELMGKLFPPEALKPDADLGKSLRPGFRNEWHDPNRVFGVPSVRTDQPVPKLVSIASTVNYGEEADARHLLNPSRATHMGITESHYLAPLSKEDIREFLSRAGIHVAEAEFEHVFSAASEHDRTPGAASMETFMKARHMLIAAQLGL